MAEKITVVQHRHTAERYRIALDVAAVTELRRIAATSEDPLELEAARAKLDALSLALTIDEEGLVVFDWPPDPPGAIATTDAEGKTVKSPAVPRADYEESMLREAAASVRLELERLASSSDAVSGTPAAGEGREL